MSEIPFVNQLGDAIDTAIAPSYERPARRRRSRRGRLLLVLAALLTVGGGAALAGLFSNPTELASNGIGCYDSADLNGNTTVVWAGDRSPVEACEQALRSTGQPVPALVACDSGRGAVAVFPGRGARACKAAGLRALPAGYVAERARVSRLGRDVIALEATADCIAPREFAARVQAILRRTGWTGWRTWLRPDVGSGPCGTVSGLGGNGVRTIGGALDHKARRVMVFTGPHRSTEGLLGAANGGLAGPLIDDSGDRCYSPTQIRAFARRRLEASGRNVRFEVSRPTPHVELMGQRGKRLAAGCTLVVDVRADRDGLGLVVEMWQRG